MSELLIVILCLALNAILAAIEIAFVTVSRPGIRQMAKNGNKQAISLLKLRENPERTLSVVQVGITFVGAISAGVAGVSADAELSPWIAEKLAVSDSVSQFIAIILIVAPLTYFSVVLGELVPKTIALRHPQLVALRGAKLLVTGDKIFGPIVWLLERSTRFILKVLLIPASRQVHEDTSAISLDSLEGAHRQFVLNLVQIEGKRVRDIMLPWEQVDCVRVTDSPTDVLGKIVSSRHTRLPVLDDENHVLGILHSKEFLSFVSTGDMNWNSIIRSPARIQGSQELLKTLKTLQESKRHLSLVYVGEELKGIVTLEDIIEEVIGEIFDEDDDGFIQKILSQRPKRS